MLGIVTTAHLSLDSRKFSILARLNESTVYTYTTLCEYLNNYCGVAGYTISLDANNYQIDIKIALSQKAKFAAIDEMLKRTLPANLVYTSEFMYNKHELFKGKTHAYLGAYKHEQIRNEVMS